MIGAYLIWKYGFTASEAIAFMRIVRPGCVVGPQQQYMYCKQLEWSKWAAVDEIRKTQVSAALASATIVAPATPPAETDENIPMDAVSTDAITTPSTPPPILPPVTPSKHVAAAAAKAKSIVPPGQPRKTPNAKRLAVDSSDEEADDALPALGAAPPIRQNLRSPTKGVAHVTASEQRPARVTRSTAGTLASRRPGTALSAISTKANVSSQTSNKIPRLANGNTGRNATSSNGTSITKLPPIAVAAPVRRSQRAPSPTPSRLPTLVPSKRPYHNSVSSLGAIVGATTLKVVQATTATHEWMKNNANAVVKPGNKSERPGLRSVRRRRSSFSAADVVA